MAEATCGVSGGEEPEAAWLHYRGTYIHFNNRKPSRIAWLGLTKHPALRGLHNRNPLALGSGGKRAEIKVSAGLVASEG